MYFKGHVEMVNTKDQSNAIVYVVQILKLLGVVGRNKQ